MEVFLWWVPILSPKQCQVLKETQSITPNGRKSLTDLILSAFTTGVLTEWEILPLHQLSADNT